jgi:hypothetical protein
LTDKSAFTDEEWHALTDAPLLVTAAVFLVGEHGPISLMKEAAASARAVTHPSEHGTANLLISEIVAEANTKESRKEMREHRGPTPQATVESIMNDLHPAADALKKLPTAEAEQVAGWLVAIAEAVAESAKTVNPDEQATIDKLRTLFSLPSS